MNIYEKLNEVRKVVEYLQKDKEVAGKYMVVTHDAVTALVRPRLVEHGIVTVPNLLKSSTLNTTMTTGKGIPIIRYEATYRVSFVNMEEPTERVDVDIESHALDEGDKAPGKALSYAVKYAFLKLFNIETGEDEESRQDLKVKKDKTITPTSGAWDELELDVQVWLHDLANEARSLLSRGDIKGACDHLDEAALDNEKKIAIWTRFDSKERSAMKKYRESLKEAA
jgi:hypothetical protein